MGENARSDITRRNRERSVYRRKNNTFVIIRIVVYAINYNSEQLQDEILALPDTLAARYVVLTRRMVVLGPNLGEPHTKAFAKDCSS